ncbi:polysaccharide pyruvyl transferase family protein [Chitinophaga qingshengii]|uniref:Polysaccharide pyruvyl transferase family protein n=1 Tax=Chitinophaga qingshengii TaxID=1569794 RepID=A0ABR7TV24_9BACT|nr:polysaccharide pyruvyl transferase family protein [Chitinophaga qingshengii]MBC9934342.1 polysaccharide pyruvyl transferase family protein [Chitinophaga qingshengii]
MMKKQSMDNILLTGFFGAGNVGDEAVSLAVYEGVKEQLPDAKFSIVTRDPAYTRNFTGITAAKAVKGFYPSQDFWLRISKHIGSVKKSDLIVIGGGGILQDVHSWTTIPAFLIPACLGILYNRNVITVGIGVGPVKNGWLKELISFTCNRMAKVQVRDEKSKRVLIECGVQADKITVTADVVPSLNVKQHVSAQQVTKQAPVVALAFRKWPDLDEEGLVAICSKLIEKGVHIKMLGYESGPDKKFYEQLIMKFEPRHQGKISIHIPADLKDAMQEVRNADFLFSMRLHGCVFAAAIGTSFYAVPYDHKVTEFMRRLSLEDRMIPMDSLSIGFADKILEELKVKDADKAWSAAFDIQQQLSRNNFTMVQEALENQTNYSRKDKLTALGWIGKLLMKGLGTQLQRPFRFVLRKITK